MSHTIALRQASNLVEYVQVTVVNYTAGTGELFTIAEVQLTLTATIVPVMNATFRNSLGVAIFPIIISGGIRLYQITAAGLVEIPTTVGLNAIFDMALIVCGE